MKAFEYRHVVGFEETNLVGNVYYVNHLRWQGRCREMFIRRHAPGVVEELRSGLSLATTRCSCEYFEELSAFDDIVIRMSLARLLQTQIEIVFEYWRVSGQEEELVARGEQRIACLRRSGDSLESEAVPDELVRALQAFSG